MPTVKICAVCNGHGATNYHLSKRFSIPELNRGSSVSAGSLDLCDACWDRLVNRRTLTLEQVAQNAERRQATLIERSKNRGEAW